MSNISNAEQSCVGLPHNQSHNRLGIIAKGRQTTGNHCFQQAPLQCLVLVMGSVLLLVDQ